MRFSAAHIERKVRSESLWHTGEYVASGLGAWRRDVLGLTREPGADVCKAYLRVAYMVVSSAEAMRDEQARAAGDAASGSASK